MTIKKYIKKSADNKDKYGLVKFDVNEIIEHLEKGNISLNKILKYLSGTNYKSYCVCELCNSINKSKILRKKIKRLGKHLVKLMPDPNREIPHLPYRHAFENLLHYVSLNVAAENGIAAYAQYILRCNCHKNVRMLVYAAFSNHGNPDFQAWLAYQISQSQAAFDLVELVVEVAMRIPLMSSLGDREGPLISICNKADFSDLYHALYFAESENKLEIAKLIIDSAASGRMMMSRDFDVIFRFSGLADIVSDEKLSISERQAKAQKYFFEECRTQ